MFEIAALASVLSRDVYSVNPTQFKLVSQEYLQPHRERPSEGGPVLILWSCTRSRLDSEFRSPNHFVPCVPNSATYSDGLTASVACAATKGRSVSNCLLPQFRALQQKKKSAVVTHTHPSKPSKLQTQMSAFLPPQGNSRSCIGTCNIVSKSDIVVSDPAMGFINILLYQIL